MGKRNKPFFRFMDSESVARAPQKKGDKLVLENVSFAYPTSTGDVLKNINLSIHKGEKIAVVGVNGAGKSTLAKILSGELLPTEGSIDGSLGENCMMLQDFCCYVLTKEENIAISERTQQDPEKIKELSQKLGIETVPSGQILGREFGDTDLSGGQWQRLALSCACYRESPMMILDEPTASMDPVAENEMYSNFMQMMTARFCILISHRLTIAQYTDTILVLDHGRLAEWGNHGQLMKQNGIYAAMYQAQSHLYEEEAPDCASKSACIK